MFAGNNLKILRIKRFLVLSQSFTWGLLIGLIESKLFFQSYFAQLSTHPQEISWI